MLLTTEVYGLGGGSAGGRLGEFRFSVTAHSVKLVEKFQAGIKWQCGSVTKNLGR